MKFKIPGLVNRSDTNKEKYVSSLYDEFKLREALPEGERCPIRRAGTWWYAKSVSAQALEVGMLVRVVYIAEDNTLILEPADVLGVNYHRQAI